LKVPRNGESVILLASGARLQVLEYFNDDWIILRDGDRELHVTRDEIRLIENEESVQPPAADNENNPVLQHGQKNRRQTDNEILQMAAMPDFIDLHAEKLIPNHRDLDASSILRVQLSRFRQFLEKAIRLHMHKVYVVHGIGKGILKSEIEKILLQYPEVTSFNNGFNNRFGFGATEIILA
jgi:hypothetical protein